METSSSKRSSTSDVDEPSTKRMKDSRFVIKSTNEPVYTCRKPKTMLQDESWHYLSAVHLFRNECLHYSYTHLLKSAASE